MRGRVLQATAAVAFARAIALACLLVQLPLLSRMLTPAEFGVTGVAVAAAAYVGLIGAEPAVLPFQRHPGAPDALANYRFASGWVMVGVGAASALAVAAGAVAGQLNLGIGIAGWGIGIATSRMVATAWLSWMRPWGFAATLAVSTVVRTAVLVLLVMGGTDAALAVGAAGGACAAVTLLFAPRARPARPWAQFDGWTQRFGWSLAIAGGVFTALTTMGVVSLPLFAPADDVGRFTAMQQLATLGPAALTGMIMTAIYPSARADWDDGRHRRVAADLRRLSLLSVAIGMAAAAAFTAGDGLLPGLVVTPELTRIDIVFGLVLAATLGTVGTMGTWIHQLREHGGVILARTLVAAGAGAAAIIIGGSALGLPGSALGTVVAFVLYASLVCAGTHVVHPLAAAVLAAATAVATGVLLLPAVPSAALSIGAGLAAALCALVWVGAGRRRHASTETPSVSTVRG